MNKILLVIILFILILSTIVLYKGERVNLREFSMPIQKSRSQYVDLLKFNTILLPFEKCLQNQRIVPNLQKEDLELNQHDSYVIKQNKINPQNLKINDIIKKTQKTDISIIYSQNNRQLNKQFTLVFNNNQAIPQVICTSSNETCNFDQNTNILEFICQIESKIEDLDIQDNLQIDCSTRQALRLVSIINNNFTDYIQNQIFISNTEAQKNRMTGAQIRIKTQYF